MSMRTREERSKRDRNWRGDKRKAGCCPVRSPSHCCPLRKEGHLLRAFIEAFAGICTSIFCPQPLDDLFTPTCRLRWGTLTERASMSPEPLEWSTGTQSGGSVWEGSDQKQEKKRRKKGMKRKEREGRWQAGVQSTQTHPNLQAQPYGNTLGWWLGDACLLGVAFFHEFLYHFCVCTSMCVYVHVHV